jgi:hypothetical protein
MLRAVALLLCAGGLQAQAVSATLLDPTLATAVVSATIADQGPDVINLVTGTKVKTATLLDLTACNETDSDQLIDNSMLYQRINARNVQGITLYDSKVVTLVLSVFQDRNVYAKLFKGGQAAATVTAILLLAFKLNPVAAAALLIAPEIYQAVLPVIHSPVDLAALSADILQQNTAVKLAGKTCHAGLVIGRTSATVLTEVLTVQ